MENKPIVTCHGDQTLFATLHQTVVQGLPKEPIEWRRSYGRAPRTVRVETNFVPFNPDILPGDDDWTLLGRPFFHTYWTDCDVDTYKSLVKEDIAEWVAALKAKNIADWLIVVVVNDESRVKTKLLRASVIDKVKNDFCGKQSERCIVLSEPFKNDSRSSESWYQVLQRMRQLLLQSFNRNLVMFEEYMRAQRERRTEKGWKFSQYFMLQEELAFMFEMLGQYEDALVQYDELDALFTQFILNHAAGDSADWLSMFFENPCRSWDGLCLSQSINIEKRQLIKRQNASLLDFRNYLFSRQCTLLFLMYRPFEVAQRSIPFMHNCIQELGILEISMPPGAIDCWVFLSSLEVLQTCERFSDSGQMETYTLHTANLWNYARSKMEGLGHLCGLMPSEGGPGEQEQEKQPNSQQLNLVVELISGMSHSEDESDPLSKLRESLSSKDAFRKHYMELSELAMGTYKHIGRLRSARQIGRDLADFYMKMGEPQKAEGFLADALKMYRQENWPILADHTRLDMAKCQKSLANPHKYAKSCVHVAASSVLSMENRLHHMQEMLDIAKTCKDEPMCVRTRPAFLIKDLETTKQEFLLDGQASVKLTIVSNLPKQVTANHISLSLVGPSTVFECGHSRSSSMSSAVLETDSVSSTSSLPLPEVLDLEDSVEYKPDHSVAVTGVFCRTVLRRTDSASMTKEREIIKDSYDISLTTLDVTIEPGINEIEVCGLMTEIGPYNVNQICIQIDGIDFIKSMAAAKVKFEVISTKASVVVKMPSEPLLAGLHQQVMLEVNAGTEEMPDNMPLNLTTSDNLSVTAEHYSDGYINLPPMASQERLTIALDVLAQLSQTAEETIIHKLTLEADWLVEPVVQELSFSHILQISHKLHTAGQRKYIQVCLHSPSTVLQLCEPSLEADSPDVEFISFNKATQSLIVSEEQSASYMWEFKSNIANTPPLSCTFSVRYHLRDADPSEAEECKHVFTVQDYKTLYSVKSEVLPVDSNDDCQVGANCSLKVKIHKAASNLKEEDSLMYEIMFDSATWMLGGRTSGVFQIEGEDYETILEAVPLIGGYLPVPIIKLMRYKKDEEDATEQDRKSSLCGFALCGFEAGQVYNRSAAAQVRVMPAVNTSFSDVC